MRNSSFAVFILTHGRADNVITYGKLRYFGYTGKIYLVCDSEDEQLPKYKKAYGEEVLVFDKDEAKKLADHMDNFNERRTITFARNICWSLAAQLGIEYFVEMDDDYYEFTYRFTQNREFTISDIHNIDDVFDAFVDFMKEVPSATSIAFAQGGDFIGGGLGMGKKIFFKRKAMNTFFCRTSNPVYFSGTFNEDVNTYVGLGNIGYLYFTSNVVCMHQKASQGTEGGITEAYKKFGTYTKSFYTVMRCPSCVRITMMGDKHYRVHHMVTWRYAVPKIISEKWKKTVG